MLAISRALMGAPELMLLDEPSLGLSPKLTREIFEIIKHLNDLGTTVLMITHRVDYAAAYARRAVVMNQGRVAYDGPVLELISDPERMQANSLDLPDITRLALQLRRHGVPSWTLQYEQLEGYLKQLAKASHGD